MNKKIIGILCAMFVISMGALSFASAYGQTGEPVPVANEIVNGTTPAANETANETLDTIPRADLTIGRITRRRNRLFVRIDNIGDEDSPAALVRVSWEGRRGRNFNRYVVTEPIPAGQYVIVRVNRVGRRGLVTVDPYNAIRESNGGNNIRNYR